ncbi:hypothetical protein AA313_de0201968 [Arthrobotrys entomopaga]|nr:hypothetical protein AA313_de0201968 [Arthrobotrys entomopaga]
MGAQDLTPSESREAFVQVPLGPPPGQVEMAIPHQWINNMFCCFGECDTCCITFCCPCITYGDIKQNLNGKERSEYNRCCNASCWGFCGMMVCGLQWVMSFMARGELRRKYNLKGSGCGDCFRHFCCECCALIQEEREIRVRKELIMPKTMYQPSPTAPMMYGRRQT